MDGWMDGWMDGCMHACTQNVCMNLHVHVCMHEHVFFHIIIKGSSMLIPFCGVSFGADWDDFLVRQSIVPSAMLVMANKIATTRNTIATIAYVTFVASLSAT